MVTWNIVYGSIHLTSYCSAIAIGLNTVGQVIKNFGKKQKGTPLVNHEVDKVTLSVCCRTPTGLGQLGLCTQPVHRDLLVVLQSQARILLHRADCLWLAVNFQYTMLGLRLDFHGCSFATRGVWAGSILLHTRWQGLIDFILQWTAKLRLNIRAMHYAVKNCIIQITISIACIMEVGTNI